MSDSGVLSRLRNGLSKTSDALTEGMATAVLGKKELDEDVITELEDRLIIADVGMETTTKIVGNLAERIKRKQLTDIDVLYDALQDSITEILTSL